MEVHNAGARDLEGGIRISLLKEALKIFDRDYPRELHFEERLAAAEALGQAGGIRESGGRKIGA